MEDSFDTTSEILTHIEMHFSYKKKTVRCITKRPHLKYSLKIYNDPANNGYYNWQCLKRYINDNFSNTNISTRNLKIYLFQTDIQLSLMMMNVSAL